MSKVCTIIAYIVSIYSNIEQWNLALSYSILFFSFVSGNTNRVIL